MDESVSPSLDNSHAQLPTIIGNWDWNQVIGKSHDSAFARVVAGQITKQRWYGAKAKEIRAGRVWDAFPLGPDFCVVLAEIEFSEGPTEVYQLPLGFASGEKARRLLAEDRASAWVHIKPTDERAESGVLYDAVVDAEFCQRLLGLFDSKARVSGTSGVLQAEHTSAFAQLRGDDRASLTTKTVRSEQSNTSVVYDNRLILKLFRRVEMGLNPDQEVTEYLTDHGFGHVAPLAGSLEYRTADREPMTLAVLQGFVPNQGDAWTYTLTRIQPQFDGLATSSGLCEIPGGGLCKAAKHVIPASVCKEFGAYFPDAELLGLRTAEMHLALASGGNLLGFIPEPFTDLDRQSWCQRACLLATETLELLRNRLPDLPENIGNRAAQVVQLGPTIHATFQRLLTQTSQLKKIRCHGDYHLGQVLSTGSDFVIIDFEGEPARSLRERREKQLALRDVAGMIRSFHYASYTAAKRTHEAMPHVASERIENRADAWWFWTSVAFLAAYRRKARDVDFLPSSDDEFQALLDLCLLEKATYELRYELNNRPDWVYLPLQALVSLLGNDAAR
jgi:maltose alpha-D-glucosyltransferase/alpha-amylase